MRLRRQLLRLMPAALARRRSDDATFGERQGATRRGRRLGPLGDVHDPTINRLKGLIEADGERAQRPNMRRPKAGTGRAAYLPAKPRASRASARNISRRSNAVPARRAAQTTATRTSLRALLDANTPAQTSQEPQEQQRNRNSDSATRRTSQQRVRHERATSAQPIGPRNWRYMWIGGINDRAATCLTSPTV